MGFFQRLFKSTDYKQLLAEGAIIIDVRSEAEFRSGHITQSKNIPLDQLRKKMDKLPKDKAIICCCASGMRSATAKGVLQSKGFRPVYNGGGWMSLNGKIN